MGDLKCEWCKSRSVTVHIEPVIAFSVTCRSLAHIANKYMLTCLSCSAKDCIKWHEIEHICMNEE